MFVDFNILNQLGSPSINSNTFANRPAAGQTGRLFVSIDTFEIYRDNGTTWDLIGGPGSSTVTGTGAATQVAYWTAAQSIGGSNNLWWDNTSGFLGVGSNAPTARIEAVKTDGIGIYANYTTNAGSGSSATAIWAKNVTNSSGYGAVIEETTPNATAGQYPLLIKHSLSSGTAGVGMGTGVHWQLPDDAGTFKTTQLTVETINAAAATYATRYRFNVQSNGSSTPVAYLNATGLGIFTATPGAALDIHSTGIMAQLNSTSATANSLLAFQRSGSGLWRIGDQYNGGNNYFELHNTVLTNNAIQVLASSNEATFLSSKTYSTGNAIGVAVQHNLTIPNAVNVGLAAIGGVNSNLNLTLGGSTTVSNTGRQGLEGSTTINFTGAGTLTMTQGSTVRAFSALSSVYAFNGSAVGTITHLAGLRICFPDNVGSAVNITNNYALLINDQTTGTGTVTYTNRWGVYQEGASDLNYMAANLLLGSTTNNGNKLQVTGNADFTGSVGIATNNPTYKLDVYNVGGSAAALRLYGNDQSNVRLRLENVGAGGRTWELTGGLTGADNSAFTIYDVTAAATRLQINASGNLGLGITPSAWGSNWTVFDQAVVGSLAATGAGAGDYGLAFNSFNDNTNWIYKYTGGTAMRYRLNETGFAWFTAPIGTAGNAITFTQAMTLDATGCLSIGTTGAGGTAADKILAVEGTSSGQINLRYNNTSGAYLYSNATNTVLSSVQALPLLFNTTNTERARITAGGNFLIGTTTDAGYKFFVNGISAADSGFLINNGQYNTLADVPYIGMYATGSSSPDFFGALLITSRTDSARPIVFGISNGTNSVEKLRITTGGNLESQGSIKTAAPTTGTAANWKLGSRVAATVVLDTTQYIELDVGGTLYKLAIVT